MFEKARLKLTAIYLITIMAVSVTFSLVIYRVLLFEILRFEKVQRFRIERRIQFFNTPIPDYPELIDEIKGHVKACLKKTAKERITDWGVLKYEVRNSLGKFIYGKLKRRPMIIPIIVEV